MDNSNEADLRQLLVAAYGVAEAEIALIRTGGDGNQTFKVTTNRTLLIARVYGEQGRLHPDWARYELELLAHLASNGISVAAPVAAHNGTWMQFLPMDNAPPVPVALFAFAEGGVEWPTSPPRAHLLGAAFAQLHRVADGFHTTAGPRAFDLERLLQAPLRRIRTYLADSDSDDRAAWETFAQTAVQATALFAKVPDAGGAIGPIHGDLHQGNCHFNGSGQSRPTDFLRLQQCGHRLACV
jgi:Ser/Thr protein kinase RdoA (MazF antagonist)